ncbi:hypothetical protein B0O99DRAFT_59113 [Bisporella sp. PMI_857]|nr:hypothetical protein B0O99DRAFT_59113 [Bisporella sp. PMI_857]
MTTHYETFSVDLAAKNAFDEQLAQCTMKAVCNGHYVRTSVFIKWLQSKVPYRQHGEQVETSQANRLLYAAYRKNIGNGVLPISVDALSNDKDQSLLVFSILFEIGLGHIIHGLMRLDKVDRHLPIPLYVLQETFRELHLADWEKSAARFNDKQWKFCPPQFELGKARDLRGNHVLPICRRKPINEQKGGTAKLLQIEVLEEFVGPNLRGAVKNSRYEEKDGLGPRYQFALKVFHEGSRYENEKNAFYAL